MADLIIENVDLEALEKQRKALNRAMGMMEEGRVPRQKTVDELRGLENMLDHWSDEIYHAKEGG